MSITETISSELTEAVQNCLGERFQHGVLKVIRMETKGEKMETKVLALSKFRAFILPFKVPTKLEHEFHFLEINQLESLKPLELKIHVSLKKDALHKTIFNISANSTEEIDSIIEFVALEIKKCFPTVFPIENIIPRLIVKPESRITSLNVKLEETYPDPGPCGGFTQMYSCMCDLHQELFMAEVAWDVDTIYLSQNSKELCLNDFDHLSNRDLVPIVSALIYNNWFTKLSFRNACKLSADSAREINKVLQKSSYLEQLVLENVGLKGSFTQDMCTAILENRNTALRHISLSNNTLDDRGVRSLSSLLTKLPNGLVELSLARTGLTAEGTLHFGKALMQNNFMATSLVKLDLSGNAFRDGDISNLTGFLAQPNSITHLNMADTECALDNVFVALYRGCASNLSHLNLAGNTFTYRKGKDVPIQVSFKQFFASSTKLKYLNLSRNKLPPDVVKEVLLGIGSNNNLHEVELDFSSNELKTEGATVIAGSIAHVNNIASLNLSNNDFNQELAHLVDWIGQNKTLQSLDISKNMGGLKYKQLLKVLDTIVQVIQNEELSLHTLSLADNKMKFETIQVINALGSNTTLTDIDISGNGMGDIGARMLAKALQLNTKLHTVKLDCNGITYVGLNDLANALEKNYTLKYMPTPVHDVTTALKSQPEKTSASLLRIQSLLQRNHSQHKFHDDQAFRLQQGFLYTTSHQMVDKLVVQIQDTVQNLADCNEGSTKADVQTAQDFILDADNSKLLLAALHQVALKAESSDLKAKLNEMADQLRTIIEKQLQGSASGMMDVASKQCPNIMKDSDLKSSLDVVCQEQTKMPERFLLDVVEQVGADVSNRMGEAHLAMASHISDTIIDEIMEQLTESYQKLSSHLTDYSQSRGSVLTNGTEMSVEDDVKENGEKEGEMPGEKAKSPDATQPSSQLRMSRYQKREVGRSVSILIKDTEPGQRRKSVKVRPRSVVMRDFELTLAEVDEIDSADKLGNDITASPAAAKQPLSPSKPKSPIDKAATKKSGKKAAADTKALDALTQSTETLTDVRKNRPRPPRQRPSRPTANHVLKATPSIDLGSNVPPVDAGVSAFFSADLTDIVAAKPGHGANTASTVNSSASPDLGKQKKRRLFQKKDEKPKKVDKKEDKKEEAPKSKKFGLKGIFKKKHDSDGPQKQDGRRGSQTEQSTPAKEVSKTPSEEPSPKITEKKTGHSMSTHKPSKAAVISTAKEPELPTETPAPETKEDKKANEVHKEKRGSVKNFVKDEEAGKEDNGNEGLKEETDVKEEKEGAESKEETEEEPKKAEVRKPYLAGAHIMGGASMLQEMKLKREKKAADRASREILESQSPKVEESPKESGESSQVAPGSPDKLAPGLKLSLPKATSPGPTSPSSEAKSPTLQSTVSPTKPNLSPRVKSPIESPKKSPLDKTPSTQPPSDGSDVKATEESTKTPEQDDSTDVTSNAKPKIEKEKPVLKLRPLSGKIDQFQVKPPATTPEASWKSDTGAKPSEISKRNSLEAKDTPANPEKGRSVTDVSKLLSLEPSEAKPNGAMVSPKPKPRPAKRPVSLAKKPEFPDNRKASAPSVTVSPSAPDSETTESLPKTIQKASSLTKDVAGKPPPMVATKPRSRSLDPTMATKVHVDRKPSTDLKAETLLEVPSPSGKRDSVLSNSSNEDVTEDADEYSAL